MDGAGPTQWESGVEFPPSLRRRTRLHEEEIDPTRLVVVDVTVADSDPNSEIHNRMSDLVEHDFQEFMTWCFHLCWMIEHDSRPTPADEDFVNPTLGNVTMMDTATDASGAQSQVSARGVCGF